MPPLKESQNKQKRFSKWAWGSSLFLTELEGALRIKSKNFIAVFFFNFIRLCDSRKIYYLNRELRVKLHLKTDSAPTFTIGQTGHVTIKLMQILLALIIWYETNFSSCHNRNNNNRNDNNNNYNRIFTQDNPSVKSIVINGVTTCGKLVFKCKKRRNEKLKNLWRCRISWLKLQFFFPFVISERSYSSCGSVQINCCLLVLLELHV